MRRALRLSLRGQGTVEPNPMVGCVIVRGGQIIGEGFHRRFGGPHAEIEALRACRADPAGATVYVTLEPCCYTGKTPPCTRALIEARVARVVAATRDPNPRVRGRGLARLRRAGIAVEIGLCEREARQRNAPYFTRIHQRRPWIVLKWAQSLDGRIATRTGDSRWISDARARAHAHRVRGRVDAVVVGVGTVLRDDPLLTCRVGRPRRTATRVVLDPLLRTPPACRLVTTAGVAPTLLVCTGRASLARRATLQRAGCEVLAAETVQRTSGSGGSGHAARREIALRPLLRRLARRGWTNVLVEGGSATLGRFFDDGLFDELHVYVAPSLIGGAEAPGPLGGVGAARVADAAQLGSVSWRRLGDGWLLTARR